MSEFETFAGLNEFDLIRHISDLVPSIPDTVGIGDDAAVLDVGGDDLLLATVDMLVDGTHFVLPDAPLEEVGRRAVAVNVSDIAAMGGKPTYALVSLALPLTFTQRDIGRLYHGLVAEALKYSASIVGGNISSTAGPLCIDLTMMGTVPRGEVVLRSGARPGDMLVVTGALGASAARRLACARTARLTPHETASLNEIASVPSPRLATARCLAVHRLIHAMMDLSDGVSGDIHRLCEASAVGAIIQADALPISDGTRTLATYLGLPAHYLALSGGEDYELLMAIEPGRVAEAASACSDVPFTIIGTVVNEREGVSLLQSDGTRRRLEASGWDHFGRKAPAH